MRRKGYDYQQILADHRFQVIDLAMNCILIRANTLLETMAREIGKELPDDIKHAMRVAPHSLETLWDDRTGYYFNRDAMSGELILLPSSATFLPLYAMQLPPARVKVLLEHLHNPKTFATKYPIPSAPLNSSYFNPHRYWQGPSWVNLNWMVIDGLRRNGQPQEAEKLKASTIEMVRQAASRDGIFEYYSPLDGSVAGARDFSWSSALTLDLLAETHKTETLQEYAREHAAHHHKTRR
jgi:glycogen debranching enzyme